MDAHEISIIRASARAFLQSAYKLEDLVIAEAMGVADEGAWMRMAEMGWLSALLDLDDHEAFSRVAIICAELGRVLCPAPYLPSAVAAACALRHIDSDLKREMSEGLSAGNLRPVLAVAERQSTWLSSESGCYWNGRSVSGEKCYVDSGNSADAFIVTARDSNDRPVIVTVDATDPTVSVDSVATMAGANWAKVQFNRASARLLFDGWHPIEASLAPIAALHAAWCAGASARLLELTVDYASHRRQFGQPLGSFQVVQHRLADCAIANAEADSLSAQAVRLLDEDSDGHRKMSSIAFVRSTEAFLGTARSCHQVWGGMGYSTETHVHHYSRRAKVARHAWGGVSAHVEIIAQEALSSSLLRDRYRSFLSEHQGAMYG